MDSIPRFTYIYGLIDPRDNRLRYIGKSNNPRVRYSDHTTQPEDNHKGRWIKLLLRQGLKPTLIILDEVPFDDWQRYEYDWIEVFKPQLTNSKDGGIGCNPSEETRAKQSAAKKGKQPWLGKKHSDEARAKQSERAKARWERMTPEEQAESTKKRFAKPRLKPRKRTAPITDETRKKLSASLIGNKHTAKLNREQVLEILELVRGSDIQKGEIARRYNVSPQAISNILSGRCYSEWTGIQLNTRPKYGRQLTDEQVREIRQLIASGEFKLVQIAKQFGASLCMVSQIKHKKTYTDIE